MSTALAAPLAARAEPIQAVLTGFEEVPMVSTLATGEFRGVITHDDQFIDYEFAYRGLQGSVTQAHIHIAQKNVSGGIVVWLCGTGEPGTQFAGPEGTPPCTPGSGSFTGTIRADDVVVPPGSTGAQQITAGELGEVIAAMRAGAAYVNVHTSLSLPGEIRGQIRASRRP
ncbi:MAG: CHRD domain-containing protein [Gemmatimonadales bacterium]